MLSSEFECNFLPAGKDFTIPAPNFLPAGNFIFGLKWRGHLARAGDIARDGDASAPESAYDPRGGSPLRVNVTRNQPATASW